MGLYTRLCAGLVFPLHECVKGHDSVRVLRRLEQSQWWSRDRIEEDRIRRLRRFLSAVGANVAYYRELFGESGFVPERLKDVEGLARLPTLGKREIRANFDRLEADGATRLQRYNTGGSSGEPLVFLTGPARRSHDVAAKWRATRWWNVDIGDPEIVVWGSPIELSAQDRLRTARDRLLRSRLLPAFDMSEQSIARYISAIRAKRPSMLFGYPSSLFLIADYARERKIEMRDLGIKVAFVTSERLYEHQRAGIGEVFGCPVANGYGGRDAGFIAHECPEGRMHISAEDLVVEILDEAGSNVPIGQSGEIVVTHMATADFPFVRYRTGDVGTLDSESCPCGRGLAVLKAIDGRSTDFIVAADGTIMHGLALIYAIRDLPGIDGFKIIQHEDRSIELLIIPGAGYGASQESSIRDDFRRRLGAQAEVRFRVVDTIPREANGKYRYVVSKAVGAGGQLAHKSLAPAASDLRTDVAVQDA